MTVRTDLLVAMSAGCMGRIADVTYFICTCRVVSNRLVNAIAKYEYSRRSVEHDVG